VPPLIGITTASFTSPTTGWEYNRAYVACIKAIEEAGGLPILVPVSVDETTLRGIYDRLDGILLPGGGDVRPDWYGEQCHPLTGNIDDPRDRLEIQLARWSAADDRPVFGICRGHQVLNVAYGGTLVQDIPSEVGTSVIHTIPDRTPRNTSHPAQYPHARSPHRPGKPLGGNPRFDGGQGQQHPPPIGG